MAKREILYKPPPKAAKTVSVPKQTTKVTEELTDNGFTAQNVKDFVLTHPYFKYAAMCKELGIHTGNFHTWVLKADKPRIHPEILPKIRPIIEKYGYVHN